MRILLADNQPRVRSAIRLLIEQQPEENTVEEITNTQGLLKYLENSCPDVLLLDWLLAGSKPKDLLTALRTFCPNLFTIVLDSRPQTRWAALGAGANVFVSKNDPPEHLLAAIKSSKDRASKDI